MVSNQKDSQGFENSYNSYEQVREIFHFHHLPKLYFGFNTEHKHNFNFNYSQVPILTIF